MAQLSHILIPEEGLPFKEAVLTGAASAVVPLAHNKKYTVTAVDANLAGVSFHMAYGDSTVTVSTSNDLFPPGKYTLQTGRNWDHIRIHNPTSGTITVYVAQLANS